MYWKMNITLSLIFLTTMCFTLDAQTMTSQTQQLAFEAHCTSIQDVVARERCISETGITWLKSQLKNTSLTGSARKDVETLIRRQEEKIIRLDAMTIAERKQMQAQYDRAKAAKTNK
ncbi:MAG: hypothetical protein KA479_14225 [Saprospiraceae bacterium]|nr:hypothetical protein [Saprospiraceae bacterium]